MNRFVWKISSNKRILNKTLEVLKIMKDYKNVKKIQNIASETLFKNLKENTSTQFKIEAY